MTRMKNRVEMSMENEEERAAIGASNMVFQEMSSARLMAFDAQYRNRIADLASQIQAKGKLVDS